MGVVDPRLFAAKQCRHRRETTERRTSLRENMLVSGLFKKNGKRVMLRRMTTSSLQIPMTVTRIWVHRRYINPTHRHFRPSGRDCGIPNVTSPLILSACLWHWRAALSILSLAVLKGIVSVNSPHECSRPRFPMSLLTHQRACKSCYLD